LPKEKDNNVVRVTKPVEVRKQEIIDTSRRLFTENGFEKTAIMDIARTLDIAQGLVYHYFASKTELLYAVVDQIAGEELRQTNAAIDAHKGTALECLEIMFTKSPQPEDHADILMNMKRDPGLIDYVSKKFMLSAKPTLVRLIERGNADGSWDCEDADLTAQFILQGMTGVADQLHALHAASEKDAGTGKQGVRKPDAGSQNDCDAEHMKQMISGIILRVLGVSKAAAKMATINTPSVIASEARQSR
jgi:AcrR family transcriptional regulator